MEPRRVVRLCAAALSTLSASSTVATRAGAEEVAADKPYLARRVPARSNAFELTIASGYAQGFGTLQPGIGMPAVADAGASVDASVGYRVDTHYSLSFGGEYQGLAPERDESAVHGAAIAIAIAYHVSPSARVDPWLQLGSGYRMLWLVPASPAPTTVLVGPELVRLRFGLDLRVSPDVAVAPVIGADATMFVFRDAVTSDAIANPKLSTFVFAGLQGRMDIGGSSASR
jgi:hypothetical protein